RTGLFLVLEFIEGGSLAQKLAGQPLPVRDAVYLVETLARAVHHAHQRGLIHCNLQLGNVLLATSDSSPNLASLEARLGMPKLIGFEMARRREDEGGLEDLNDVRPTSYAMAPEQLFGRPEEVGPATDVYALGVILYELLTGQPPYRATTTSDLLLKVGFGILQPPRRLERTLPRVLDRICMKCLHKDPRQRYAAAVELADDLRAFQDGKLRDRSLWAFLSDWLTGKMKRR